MKQVLLIFSVSVFTLAAFGQAKFEPGYYISNDGVRTTGEIKNLDWKNNPTSIEFRSGEGAEPKQEQIGNVAEFGFTGGATFKRFAVDMDRSSELIERLDRDRNPVFARETLLLRVLNDGKATLYQYEEGNLLRFFYSVDRGPVQQLVYKRYLNSTGGKVVENEMYKQQILNDLPCASLKKTEIEQVSYTRKDLMKMFGRYNECQGSTVVTNEANEKKSVIHLTLRPGLTYNFLQISSNGGPVTEFERKVSFRIGFEMEAVLPFNNGLWAILFEPVYQTYSSKAASGTVTVDYKSLDLTTAVRRYFFVSDKGKAYANLGVAYGLPIDGGSALLIGSSAFEVSAGVNLTAGVGYQIKKFSAELNYAFPRGILGNYLTYSSRYSGPSLILGYRIK